MTSTSLTLPLTKTLLDLLFEPHRERERERERERARDRELETGDGRRGTAGGNNRAAASNRDNSWRKLGFVCEKKRSTGQRRGRRHAAVEKLEKKKENVFSKFFLS